MYLEPSSVHLAVRLRQQCVEVHTDHSATSVAQHSSQLVCGVADAAFGIQRHQSNCLGLQLGLQVIEVASSLSAELPQTDCCALVTTGIELAAVALSLWGE